MNEISPAGSTATPDLFGTNSSILGKDDFLKILVTQLRHQDPINPMEAEDFASQLAQFSSVEQLQNINGNLQSAIELDLMLNQAINNTMATTLIGKRVRAVGNEVTLVEDTDTTLHYSLGGDAKEVTIVIKDENGNIIRTVQESEQLSGKQEYVWDGKDDNGNSVDAGKYSFEVSAKDVEGKSVAADEFIVGIIDSIRYDSGSAMLLIGDIAVGLGQVLEIGVNPNGDTG